MARNARDSTSRPTGALYARSPCKKNRGESSPGSPTWRRHLSRSSRVRRYAGPSHDDYDTDRRQSTRVSDRLSDAEHLLSFAAPRLSGSASRTIARNCFGQNNPRQEITNYTSLDVDVISAIYLVDNSTIFFIRQEIEIQFLLILFFVYLFFVMRILTWIVSFTFIYVILSSITIIFPFINCYIISTWKLRNYRKIK